MANQNKKKQSVKNCLNSPYTLIWPGLERGDNKSILDEVRRVFPPLRILRKKKEEKERKKEKEQKEEKKEKGENEQNFSGKNLSLNWEDMKKSLVVGVNEVTKSLEKDKLLLVLVCKSTKPSTLTDHLILLSATRKTPACGLFGLSEVMAPLLGIKTVAACGFKKDLAVQVLSDLVEYIVCKTPPLSYSWLQMWDESILEETPDKVTTNNNPPVPSLSRDDVIDDQRNDSPLKHSLLEGKRPEKQDKLGEKSMRELGKRPFDCVYVESQIKTLVPSGKVRVKKSKIRKSRN